MGFEPRACHLDGADGDGADGHVKSIVNLQWCERTWLFTSFDNETVESFGRGGRWGFFPKRSSAVGGIWAGGGPCRFFAFFALVTEA